MDRQPPELPRQEQVVSRQTIGHIIHAAYGIGMDGTPQQPSSLQELQAKGYGYKEINFALKAGLFLETMKDMTDEVGTDFVPSRSTGQGYAGKEEYVFDKPVALLNAYGRLDYGLLKIYIQDRINKHAKKVWNGPFKQKYSNAYHILYDMEKISDDLPENVEIFDALDDGLNAILAMHKFIADHATAETSMGASFVASLPVLYQMASNNTEGKGSVLLLENGLVKGNDAEQEEDARESLYRQLTHLPPTDLRKLKSAGIERFFRLYMAASTKLEPAHLTALEHMELAFNDKDTFLDFIAYGKLPKDMIADEKARAYFEYEGYWMATTLARWFEEADLPLPYQMKETLLELERVIRVRTLHEKFFQAHTQGDTVKVEMVQAEEQDPARAKELFFRQEIYHGWDTDKQENIYTSADQITPESPTVKCAAMHSVLSPQQAEKLRPVMDQLNFHPKQINGITFVALLSLIASEQATQSQIS